MFAGIYYGGMYGGSTTAILINTPGESASMATALEATRWRRPGRGGPRSPPPRSARSSPARSRRSASTFLAPWLVEVAVKFGPEDYFSLMCVAFITVSATFGDFADPRPHQPLHRARCSASSASTSSPTAAACFWRA
jgi:putative tricarboxylic transport membrane protein